MKIKRHLHDHIFLYLILLAVIVSIFISFQRLLVKNDYLTYHEGQCDPLIESCFQSCEEEECTYYMKVQKYAPDLLAQCGKDITDCAAADTCLPTDHACLITHCDTSTDEDCETITDITIINNID